MCFHKLNYNLFEQCNLKSLLLNQFIVRGAIIPALMHRVPLELRSNPRMGDLLGSPRVSPLFPSSPFFLSIKKKNSILSKYRIRFSLSGSMMSNNFWLGFAFKYIWSFPKTVLLNFGAVILHQMMLKKSMAMSRESSQCSKFSNFITLLSFCICNFSFVNLLHSSVFFQGKATVHRSRTEQLCLKEEEEQD